MAEDDLTGGCQCGAVRFAVETPLGRASICHCRMCQKANGGFFGAFVGGENLRWTRGAPTHFQSSNKVSRGFCAMCGTPLTFEWNRQVVELAIGAFDDPAAIAPVIQMDFPSKMPWFADLAGLLEVVGPDPGAGHQAELAELGLDPQHRVSRRVMRDVVQLRPSEPVRPAAATPYLAPRDPQ